MRSDSAGRPSTNTPQDRAIIARLQRAGALSPDQPDIGRATLLRAVAARRGDGAPGEPEPRRTPLEILFGRKRFVFVAAGVFALGAVGAVSAATGGVRPNVNDVLTALQITDETPGVGRGQNDAMGQPIVPVGEPADAANSNASEHAGNAQDGINNGNASDTGLDHANDNAFEGAANAQDGANNGSASSTGSEHAADNASDGAGNAEDGINNGNPSDSGLEHSDDNASQHAGKHDQEDIGPADDASEHANDGGREETPARD